jgi:V8-like Glu-specific endopeptidase
LTIGKTDLNAIHKTIGTKTAVEKTLTVTVIDPNTVNTNAAKLLSVEDDNAKVTARAVRKESKTASKALLAKTTACGSAIVLT